MLPDPYNAHYDASGGAPTTKPYTLMALGPSTSTRKDVTAAAGYPKVMKISHTSVGKGTKARKRHLVRCECNGLLADGVTEDPSVVAAVYAVLDMPDSGVNESQLVRLWRQFVGLLRGASGDAANEGDEAVFFHRWHNGEV